MMTRKTLLLLMASASLSIPALAQQSEMQQCAVIDDSLQRLACYDNLAEKQAKGQGNVQAQGKMKNQQHGQAVAEKARQKGQQMKDRNASADEETDKKEVMERRFGMEHKVTQGSEGVDKLVVDVASRQQDPYGNWIITLSNGQVWKQTESVGYFRWDADDTYYIERGALNSFFFGREDATRRFRVTRVE